MCPTPRSETNNENIFSLYFRHYFFWAEGRGPNDLPETESRYFYLRRKSNSAGHNYKGTQKNDFRNSTMGRCLGLKTFFDDKNNPCIGFQRFYPFFGILGAQTGVNGQKTTKVHFETSLNFWLLVPAAKERNYF